MSLLEVPARPDGRTTVPGGSLRVGSTPLDVSARDGHVNLSVEPRTGSHATLRLDPDEATLLASWLLSCATAASGEVER